MKVKVLLLIIIMGCINVFTVYSQSIVPVFFFKEHPVTHNYHITSDGKNYYTINGGRASLGQISKFTLFGDLVETYSFKLDMRSIMYNSTSNKFYIWSYDSNLYQITDFNKGEAKIIFSKFLVNGQAGLAISSDGKFLYSLQDSVLSLYKTSNGKLHKTIQGISSGPNFAQGSLSVAVDNKYIYTWNSETQMLYAYDLDGNKLKEVQLSAGTFGPSLSCANGFVFVADDGNYVEHGFWYAYDIWAK